MELGENEAHLSAAAQHHVAVGLTSLHQGRGVGLGADHAAIVAAGNLLHGARGVDGHHHCPPGMGR